MSGTLRDVAALRVGIARARTRLAASPEDDEPVEPMPEDLLAAGVAANMMGIDTDQLRRLANAGIVKAWRPASTAHRQYSKKAIERAIKRGHGRRK